MDIAWQLRVYERQKLVFSTEVEGPAELGRQTDDTEEPNSQTRAAAAGRRRVVIARLDEGVISRRHILVEPLAEDRIKLTNLSRKMAIHLPDGSELPPGTSGELSLPVVVLVGPRTLRIQAAEPGELQSLAQATMAPGDDAGLASGLHTLSVPPSGGIEPESLVGWLQAAMGVLQSAASSGEFFSRAARALVDLVGFDSGRILLLEQGDWKVQTLQTAPGVAAERDWRPSRKVLDHVLQQKRTFWRLPEVLQEGTPSLSGVKSMVAAPILDRRREVIGALYGDRRQNHALPSLRPITKLEAMLVELLAGGVAAGLARVEQEQAVLRARVQFEQFFTPELSRQLAAQPDLLQGRNADVTLLFCDICGFSRISERVSREPLGPAKTVEWVADVMDTLSDCVRAHRGVLVDYIGDELLAMWGAPEAQPDHAQLACRAALAMLAQLPRLNERWQPVLQEPIVLGIGLNTGVARVGNTGSRHKFKYGPLGNTVNLASRVQGATRYLKSRLLITGTVQARLSAEFNFRRLCRVRVVNITEPVDLYELVEPGQPGWAGFKQGYEEGLQKFEAREFLLCARILGKLLSEHPYDGPALVLISRTINCLMDESLGRDTVWDLPGK
jgi:adenylate cyclase